MEEKDIYDTLIKLIHDYVPELTDKPLAMETVINTETNIDSMGFVLIISKLEGIYDIKISDRQMRKFITIADVVRFVKGKVDAKATA
ncbi:MAG: acyl carrier protein [Bacilli bacterium]|jgi:acyl carrier protein|nr:acyl carrier protein [Bacilli bacterium]